MGWKLLRGSLVRTAVAILLCAFAACATGANGRGDGGVLGVDGGAALADGGLAADGGGADGGAVDGGGADGGLPACSPVTCSGPGQQCFDGGCLTDCRRGGATPCPAPTVCNVGSEGTGTCAEPGDGGCVITSPPVSCSVGDGGTVRCGTGSQCWPGTGCYPRLPCREVDCDGDGCWGTQCPCTRPAASCQPAPVGARGDPGTLNDLAFTQCGTVTCSAGGLVDLDFDQHCNAWGVTILSGPDYLRRVTPDGGVSSLPGVTNLNMGEVAALQGYKGQFGQGGADGVALTYICCAQCGCQSLPQGVAELDPATQALPMRINAVQTTGTGPFSLAGMDTGPYGLTWGLDRVLYAGNVEANGDFFALDLETQQRALIHEFARRVYAAAPWDRYQVIVALDGGDVVLVPVLGQAGEPRALLTLPLPVTSILRDPWSGRGYASLYDVTMNLSKVVAFSADGSEVTDFQTTPGPGRIAISPDGALYHLKLPFPGSPTQGEILRWDLPTTP